MKYDVIIIGGGIIGLSTAYKIQQKHPALNLMLLEKEDTIGRHQTGHNSGVIHSGLYYKPGSLKAKNCVQGYGMLLDFCDQHNIAYEICGKLVVATEEEQLPLLDTLRERGEQNGLQGIKVIAPEALSEYEPYVKGLEGLWVPQTGIINYQEVAARLAQLFQENGGEIKLKQEVRGISTNGGTVVITSQEQFNTRLVVGCAGLYSDRVAKLTEPELDIRIIPFRGEYYQLTPEKEYLVNNLIYPVPDPNFPFLGVHFTRMKMGGVEAGPNAVLATSREGYHKTDFNLKDFLDTISWPGFQKVALTYWDKGLGEIYRSLSKLAFTRALQKLIPDIDEGDLVPHGAGVRAQASTRDGGLLDDFYIVENPSGIHVCNAPSPAATSSLAIGNTIAEKVMKRI